MARVPSHFNRKPDNSSFEAQLFYHRPTKSYHNKSLPEVKSPAIRKLLKKFTKQRVSATLESAGATGSTQADMREQIEKSIRFYERPENKLLRRKHCDYSVNHVEKFSLPKQNINSSNFEQKYKLPFYGLIDQFAKEVVQRNSTKRLFVTNTASRQASIDSVKRQFFFREDEKYETQQEMHARLQKKKQRLNLTVDSKIVRQIREQAGKRLKPLPNKVRYPDFSMKKLLEAKKKERRASKYDMLIELTRPLLDLRRKVELIRDQREYNIAGISAADTKEHLETNFDIYTKVLDGTLSEVKDMHQSLKGMEMNLKDPLTF